MTDQAQDPLQLFTAAADHADQLASAALVAIVMVREAYRATGPGHGHDGRAEMAASAVAVVNAARELANALWTAVEATKENAEVEGR